SAVIAPALIAIALIARGLLVPRSLGGGGWTLTLGLGARRLRALTLRSLTLWTLTLRPTIAPLLLLLLRPLRLLLLLRSAIVRSRSTLLIELIALIAPLGRPLRSRP